MEKISIEITATFDTLCDVWQALSLRIKELEIEELNRHRKGAHSYANELGIVIGNMIEVKEQIEKVITKE